MSLAGNLKTMPFADILQFLSVNQSTGTLQVRQQQIIKMIFFEKGKIVFSSSSDPKEYLGHFLVSHGLINEEELRMAMEIQRNSKMLLGKVLVMGGKVEEAEMTRLLQLKAEETVYSLFLWDEGEFNFYKDEFVDRLFIRISLDPQSLLFEGTLRRDEWDRIRESFPHNNIVLEKAPGMRPDLNSFDAPTRRIYENIDGKRTIDDLALALHAVEFVVCRALYSLHESGYLRIKKVLNSTEHKVLGGDHTVEQLLALGRERLIQSRYEEALDLFREINPSFKDFRKVVVPLLEQAEKQTVHSIYSNSLSPDRLIKLKIPLSQISFAGLTPEEGFLLSRIDGNWDVKSILSVTPMKEVDALRLLKGLLERGMICLV